MIEVKESENEKTKTSDNKAFLNEKKIEASNNNATSNANISGLAGNSTVLESGLIKNNSERIASSNETTNPLPPLSNSSITSENQNSNSTGPIETKASNNASNSTSNVTEKFLDHITVTASESNKTLNHSNNSTNTNQTKTEFVEHNNETITLDNNSTTIHNSNATVGNSTLLSSNHTSFIEMKTNTSKDHKTNLRAKASIII